VRDLGCTSEPQSGLRGGQAASDGDRSGRSDHGGRPGHGDCGAAHHPGPPGTRALRVPIHSRDRLLCDSFAMADQPQRNPRRFRKQQRPFGLCAGLRQWQERAPRVPGCRS
jgi:hypothetical protein